MITFQQVSTNEEIRTLIDASCNVLTAMNYTEHGIRHARYVSRVSGEILSKLGYKEELVELAKIAGYVHDIGNSINRHNHGITAGLLIYPILKEMGMSYENLGLIISAVGNHEEEIGAVINEVCAALIIADKSDAHKTRVKRSEYNEKDIHDRVNYAIKKNIVEIKENERIISSRFYMDESSSVMEYFKIYLPRIVMSEKAANFLKCTFRIYINDVLINSVSPIY